MTTFPWTVAPEELAEIESRNFHLEAAYASLYDYCVRRAGMSEATASRKSNAARLVRRSRSCSATLTVARSISARSFSSVII